VHCDVDASIQQRLVNLLCEQTLAANICQGLTQDLVTCGLNNHDFKSTLLSKLWEVGLQHTARSTIADMCRVENLSEQLGQGQIRHAVRGAQAQTGCQGFKARKDKHQGWYGRCCCSGCQHCWVILQTLPCTNHNGHRLG
jgi:hypothetical protein